MALKFIVLLGALTLSIKSFLYLVGVFDLSLLDAATCKLLGKGAEIYDVRTGVGKSIG